MTISNLSQVLDNPQLSGDADISCDDPKRGRYVNSLWQRLIHLPEKWRLDKKVKHDVVSFFQERYGYQNENAAFKRVWERVGAKVWTPGSELKASTVRAIDKAFKEQLIYHGHGVPSPQIPETSINQNIQKVVQWILHCGKLPENLHKNKEIMRAILVEQDPELMKTFRGELQRELDSLAKKTPKNPQEEVLWRAFLGNILALMPFTYPKGENTITIPVLINGICERVEYGIEVILLSTTEMATPMHALGLTPKEAGKAPPILAYTGTTFPGGDGFMTTVLADFTPGHSVGEDPYKRNHKAIDGWMQNKKGVHVLGMSLGGSMAFHTLLEYSGKLARVDAYVPAGLNPEQWEKRPFPLNPDCSINIYCQPEDVVSHLGAWPVGTNVSLYSVIPHQKGVKENMLDSHLHAFTGANKVTILKKDPATENKQFSRRLTTWAHRWLSPFFIYLPLKISLWFHHHTHSINVWAKKFFKST